jgi:DNA-directed RNA polymerase specialized sigma24 family protein
MKYFEELKYEQISEILGTSVGALKASYHHAVKNRFNHQLNLLPKIKSYTYYESI